jgi:type IV secretory pathway TraG/TraD family ATPase VirD4
MQHRYGPQIAEAMLACCNTKLFLQTIDSETRQWASRTIGECEVETPTMTDALAGMDDGARTTLSKMRKMRPAVLESELRLAAFEGYLLFPDGLPVSKIKLTADHIARRGHARHPGFIAGDPDSTLWKKGGSVAPQSSPPSTTQGPV